MSKTAPPGWRLDVHRTLPSTQDTAVAAAQAGAPAHLAVLAHEQTAGRGSRGRNWAGGLGNLYLSMLLRPDNRAPQPGAWALMTGVVLHEAVAPHLPNSASLRLKWPNDLLLGDAKLAGIIIDSATTPAGLLDWVVIGIGINLAEAPAVDGRQTASLAGIAAGRTVEDWALDLLDGFDKWLGRPMEDLRDAWLDRAHPIGTWLDVVSGTQSRAGAFAGLSQDGSLLLSTQTAPIGVGEVFIRQGLLFERKKQKTFIIWGARCVWRAPQHAKVFWFFFSKKHAVFMLLVVDAGNTNVVFAIHDGRRWAGIWRIATEPQRTSDEYAVWLLTLLTHAKLTPDLVSAAVIGTVVPAALYHLRRLCREWFEVEPLVARARLDWGFDIRVDTPEDVGADRLLNALAAFHHFRAPLVVIDFGTATTFDVVGADGAYMGGAIAPGINLSIEALHQAAARLPRIGIGRPQAVIGTGTVSAMQSGIYWGYIGLIEGLVTRIRGELEHPLKVVATGGLAPLFAEGTEIFDRIDPDLTLNGLRMLAERNPTPRLPRDRSRTIEGD